MHNEYEHNFNFKVSCLKAVKTTGTTPTALKNSSYTAEYALEIMFHHQGPLSLKTNHTRVCGSIGVVHFRCDNYICNM